MTVDVPSGFEPLAPYGRFGAKLGAVHVRTTGERSACFGLRVTDEHCGLLSYLHGGMLAALVDTAFTWSTRRLYDDSWGMVTTHLSIDYLDGAQTGDWVELDVEVLRSGRRLCFLSGMARESERTVARASGQFQIIARAQRPLSA